MSLARENYTVLISSRRGSSLIEYVLLLAFMACTSIYAAQLLGNSLNERLSLVFEGGGSTGTLKPEEGPIYTGAAGNNSGDSYNRP